MSFNCQKIILMFSFINPDTFKKTLGNNYFSSSKYFFSIGAVISPSVMNNFSLWLDHFEKKFSQPEKNF